MKKFLLIVTLQVLAYASFSQSSFSIVSYRAPEGWYAKQNGENLVLTKKGVETTNCKLVFFKPTNKVVNSEDSYSRYRNDMIGTATLKAKSWTPIQKESGPEWLSFSSMQHIDSSGTDIAFYSISNSTETVFIAVYSGNNALCADELDSIISSLDLTESNTDQKGDKTKKAKAVKKVRVSALKSLKALVN